MTALRVAVIGTGMIADAHVRAARDAGAVVGGVLGSSASRSRQAAERWGVPAGYASVDELIADRPDVVHVCTPNDTHVDYALAATAAGLHTVVEKPVAMTLPDARRLAEAVHAAGTVSTVPYVYRYHPMVRELRARVAAGTLGRVLTLHGSYLQDWMVSPDASTWRVDPERGGPSRAFADIGTHWTDLAEFITGTRFTELTARTSIAYPERPDPTSAGASFGGSGSATGAGAGTGTVPVRTEDTAVVTFATADGTLANTVVSQVAAGRKNRLWIEVDGSQGSAVFDQEHPESVWFGGEHGSTTVHRAEGPVSADQARLNRTPAGHSQGWTDAFAAFCADTYAAVRGETPEGLPTVEDGVRSLEVVDAVLRGAATGRWTSTSTEER
ncbi:MULTISPECIES: Gfo/Idh/MocA family oxidoreductase [unclassified Curtobacterium]|uniref:Gfo/Idh/MocA family protein n=1 Tax=unclassified Curtobacterium TaxID=257496 RepID=UPI0021ACCD9A|nr:MULTISPECIES: Gfo/Idh/MocA family oxidoreductase [unclassified Curtobacterium]WIE72970.1 Gfo/Idh/MocA family oxidoreductase [Curtobacterium sp. MCJR17_020]